MEVIFFYRPANEEASGRGLGHGPAIRLAIQDPNRSERTEAHPPDRMILRIERVDAEQDITGNQRASESFEAGHSSEGLERQGAEAFKVRAKALRYDTATARRVGERSARLPIVPVSREKRPTRTIGVVRSGSRVMIRST